MEAFPATWWTAARLQRLAQALVVIPPVRAAVPFDEAVRSISRRSRGSREEILRTLEALQHLGAVTVEKGRFGRTLSGDSLSKALARGDHRPLGLALIQVGIFQEQGRVLFEASRLSATGNLECPAKVARNGAAQLLAVLDLWPEVQTTPTVSIPADVFAQLDAAWIVPPPSHSLLRVALRKEVGDRAELLTYLRERSRVGTDPSLIAWVARDSDTLGWDVEDRSVAACRRIEVKGSQGAEMRFYLSENELTKAREHGENYEVQFWGGIDLQAPIYPELQRLVQSGYPRVYRNPAALIDSGGLLATPVRWRVERPGLPPTAESSDADE